LHESASGTSTICRTKHNHFGVKARVKSSKSKSGYITSYRTFESDEDSYLQIGELISHRKYYPGLKGNMDYMKWLKAIKASGYARSPSWISVIDKTINRYNLTRLDKSFNKPILLLPSPKDSLIRVK
jgi:flagellum-specific peptidoglycan hydrolase FlgJ